MKLSVCNIGWSKENEQCVLELLKRQKFDAIEIAPTVIIKDDPYNNVEKGIEYLKFLKKNYNLTICSMQSIWYGIDGNIFNDNEQKELIDYTYKAIDFAKAINCNNIVFGCPKARNKKDSNMTDEKAISFFEKICKYAKEKNIVISLEPNPKIYNTNFINTTKEAFEFIKKINISSLKVNIDFGTIIENNEDTDYIFENIKYVNHIHISEPYLLKIKERSIHHDFIQNLKKLNYKKYVSIEMKYTNNLNDLKDSINYLRRLVDEMDEI